MLYFINSFKKKETLCTHISFPEKYLKYIFFSPIILTKIKWKHLTHDSMREEKERKKKKNNLN